MAKTGAAEQKATVRVGSSRKATNGSSTAVVKNGRARASTANGKNGRSTTSVPAPAKNGRARVDDPALARLPGQAF